MLPPLAALQIVQRQGTGVDHPPHHEAGVHAADTLDAGHLVEQKVLIVVDVRHHHLHDFLHP